MSQPNLPPQLDQIYKSIQSFSEYIFNEISQMHRLVCELFDENQAMRQQMQDRGQFVETLSPQKPAGWQPPTTTSTHQQPPQAPTPIGSSDGLTAAADADIDPVTGMNMEELRALAAQAAGSEMQQAIELARIAAADKFRPQPVPGAGGRLRSTGFGTAADLQSKA